MASICAADSRTGAVFGTGATAVHAPPPPAALTVPAWAGAAMASAPITTGAASSAAGLSLIYALLFPGRFPAEAVHGRSALPEPAGNAKLTRTATNVAGTANRERVSFSSRLASLVRASCLHTSSPLADIGAKLLDGASKGTGYPLCDRSLSTTLVAAERDLCDLGPRNDCCCFWC